MGLFVDKLTGNIYLFDIPNSSGGTGGSGSTYTEVNTFADLPPAASFATKIFVVRTSTGAYMINRKEAGLYFSNGVVWRRLGDIPSFFNDDNFEIYDGDDNTKRVKFQASGLTSSSLRLVTLRDSNGTMAYLSDLESIEADIDYISGQTGNVSRFGTARYVATTNNQTASDPGSGKLKWNNATLSASTRIYIDNITDTGVDINNFLGKVSIGTILYIQELNDADNTQTWEITGLTNNSGWWTLHVVFLGGSGSFSNNNKIGVMIGSVTTSEGVSQEEFNEYTASTKSYIDQVKEYAAYGTGTGLITGGTFVATGGTTFRVNAGAGLYIDQYSNPANPVIVPLSWGMTAPMAILTGSSVTYVSISSGGTFIRRANSQNPQQRREEIFLGLIIHPAGVITGSNSTPIPAYDILPTTHDIFDAIGIIKTDDGNKVTARGGNLQLKKSQGIIFSISTNLRTNIKDPNFKTIAASNPMTFLYRRADGTDEVSTTFVDPTKYEVTGVTSTIVTITGSTAKATAQRVYLFQAGGIRIQRGQRVYNSLEDAFANFLDEPFVTEARSLEDGLLIGVILMRAQTTDLANTRDVVFISTDRFGSIIGGANGGNFNITNYQLVKSVRDFPEAVAGSIQLQDNFTYQINGTVNIGNNRLVLGESNNIIGLNSSTDILVSTGSTRPTIYGRGRNFNISTLTLRNTVGDVFDLVGNNLRNAIIRRLNLVSTRPGKIGGYNFVLIDNVGMFNPTGGFTFSGQSTNQGELSIRSLLVKLPSSNTTAVTITGGSFNSLDLSLNYFHVTGTSRALRISSGTTLTLTGAINSNQFFGNGTYLTGTLTKAAPNWDFRGNTNLLSSETFGFLRFSGNTSVTIINATTDFIKAVGTNFNASSERFVVTNNRLQNNSNKTLNFIVLFTGDLSVGGGTETIQVALVKNGTQRLGTVEARTTTANQPVPFAYSDLVSLAQGDYLEVFVRNLTSTSDIIMRNLQFRANVSV